MWLFIHAGIQINPSMLVKGAPGDFGTAHSIKYAQGFVLYCGFITPDSKVHGANMGPTWVLSAPGGPHVGLMNLAI